MVVAGSWAAVWTSGLVAGSCFPHAKRCALLCRAAGMDCSHAPERKKVVVVGAGWAGLAAAYHLSKQGASVTVLGAGDPVEVGMNGFWCPYRNIFSLVDELGIRPFTNWTRSALYSPEGMQVEIPIYGDRPRLPAPLGALAYTQFLRLPAVDQLTSLPLMATVIDFDNTDVAWRKYDPMTARELFKWYGCSERLYQEAFSPILQVGLCAPAEQCSAAAALGMLYYFILAHQQDFDVKWCRGTVKEKIFKPWVESMKLKNCQVHENKTVTDFSLDEETGEISEVICGRESYPTDAVILALGVTQLQEIVKKRYLQPAFKVFTDGWILFSSALKTKQEFLNVLKLAAIDVVSIRMRWDRRIYIPKASNACFGFDESSGWTFFDLNAIYDDYKDEPVTVVAVDFYCANQFLPLTDEQIVSKAKSYLSKCTKEFEEASVMQQEVFRHPKSVTHFFPGSYKYLMRGSTSFANLFMAGDWIINRHGSWSQEKAYVSGLEAANRVVDYFGEGEFAKIIPVEEDEPHIQTLRNLNRSINEIRTQIPLSGFFLQ